MFSKHIKDNHNSVKISNVNKVFVYKNAKI